MAKMKSKAMGINLVWVKSDYSVIIGVIVFFWTIGLLIKKMVLLLLLVHNINHKLKLI